MKKHVSVTTLLKQTGENGQEEITASFQGTFLRKEDNIMLRYDEPGNGGATCLTASPQGALLRRDGQVRSRMSFLPGKEEASAYRTPLGTLRMAVHTHAYRLRHSAQGGTMEVSYTLSINGADISRDTLRLAWTFRD